jgi:AraC-like DNA-binding protein
MQPLITLNLPGVLPEIIDPIKLASLATLILKFAQPRLFQLTEGHLLIQAFNHYIGYLEMIDFNLSLEKVFDFSVEKASVCMLITLKGSELIFDSNNKCIRDNKTNSCCLVYLESGNYYAKMDAGIHKILWITLRPEWFMSRSKAFQKFNPLVSNLIEPKLPFISLAHCPYNKDMQRALFRLQSYNGQIREKLDSAVLAFINKIISSYHSMLLNKHYITSFAHQDKGMVLKRFIEANFSSEIVEDVSKLADMLLVSERMVLRLAKESFGIPLHEVIVKYRMVYAIKHLILTNKPVREVATIVGYKDPHYFSRAFKRFHGMPPSEIYRPYAN